MLKESKICFIGSGAMATAMIEGLYKKDLITLENYSEDKTKLEVKY